MNEGLVLGLIPARGGFKQIPRKNIRPFAGLPLIGHTIAQAKASKLIDKVIVSTDDSEIARIAQELGAEVPFLRPEALAQDTTPDFPVLEHAIEWFESQGERVRCVVFLRPTQCFRTSQDIDRAIEKLLDSSFDSVRAVSRVKYPPYWMKRLEGDKLVAWCSSPYEESRRQDLPAVYQGNGTVDVIRRDTVIKLKSRYGSSIGYIEMPEIASTDIDTPLDWKTAEFLYPLWQKGELQ